MSAGRSLALRSVGQYLSAIGLMVVLAPAITQAQSIPATRMTPQFGTSPAGAESRVDSYQPVAVDTERDRPESYFADAPRTVAESDSEFPSAPIRLDLTPFLAHLGQAAESPHAATTLQGEEHYHWKGLLLQSLGFIAVENTFRLMTDQTFRQLTADKPYWHDYIASLQQWNMRRWSDGDDFLVDDIGHPMQGGVSSFIEIQNDPRARMLQISSSPAYWKSRFMGMMWATVYSTQQKIGPLGEAALGSDGGETYVPGCKYPCPSYKPGVTKYTNNTGWTDFIMTPVVGTLWVLMEDSIDRFINDPVQNAHPTALFPKIMRGGLNPCRTMANALRLKTPWYRDFQHPDEAGTPSVHFIRDDQEVVKSLPRFEIFPHFNALSLAVNTAHCAPCRSVTTGGGVGFSYRITRWLDFDSDLNRQPDASPLPSDRAGGTAISGTFGFRSGIQTPRFALKAAIRPGFVTYDRAYLTSPTGYRLASVSGPVIVPPVTATPEIGRITHFVTALSINADYGLTRHFALRAAFGNTPVRYKTDYLDRPPGRGSPPYIYFISPNIYATNENWNYQAGPVLRF